MVNKMKDYTVIYERGREDEENWGAYVPDLPGCISTGETLDEVKRNIKEAIELHIAGLKADGDPVPEPTTVAEHVSVAA
jgi:predicted RNase H-like HicB family nuclease